MHLSKNRVVKIVHCFIALSMDFSLLIMDPFRVAKLICGTVLSHLSFNL